ncbi:MAG: AraC family transcriptional regulator [Cyanobacteria bacterium P01_G01_bin.54]
MQSTPSAEHNEVSWELHHTFGTWSNRSIHLREGLDLSVVAWTLQENLSLTIDAQMEPSFGSSFCVFGDFLTTVSGTARDFITHPQETQLGFFQGDVKTTTKGTPGQTVTLIQLEIDPRLLDALTETPPDHSQHPLRGVFSNTQTGFQWQAQKITPAMTIALNQLLQCPYQGLTRRIYLESKSLELIALQLGQLSEAQPPSQSASSLKPKEIDRIYLARDILIRDIENPPSLLALAKQSGINSLKLKQGFRQVFNTTVFGYLYTHRMEEARRLLEMGDFNVTQVAQAVGYAHSGKFAAAFKKKFGITPKSLRAR